MNEIVIGPKLKLNFVTASNQESFVTNVLAAYDTSETGSGYLDIYHLTIVLESYIYATVGDDSLFTERPKMAEELENQYVGHLQSDILAVLNYYHYFTAEVDENDYPGFKLSGRLYNVPIAGVW